MKYIYLAVMAITLSYGCHRKLNANGANKNTNNANKKTNDANVAANGSAAYLDTRGNPMLLGIHPAEDLQQAPYGDWFNKNYADYKIDSSTAGQLAPLLKDKTFELFMGTWCGDSKREIPRMLKILHYAGVQPSQIKLVMVDIHDSTYKQSPGHEEKGKDIFRVPDLLVYSHDREVSRIVEHPVVSLENDLLLIARGEGYTPSYPGAAYLLRLLKEKTAAALMADKENTLALLKATVKSEGDLNSLGYVWMSAPGEADKAILALQLNAELYPTSPNVYDSLGDLYRRLNRKEEARSYYRKVLELQPGNASSAKKLAALD
ncbi:MAG TPA: tetratricopeptide repeat protein [Chitinophagaceae bacterium]|jgi:tetratricopeptide (TPR) repeat protein